MADITLSSAVRTNLLSLQSTADLLASTQEKLATGLKVNSALDDPTAFFTASSLNSRANDLQRLQDFVGNSVQTIKAADEGISAITKLVESAEATARQALNSAGNTASATGDVDTSASGFDTFEATNTSTNNVTTANFDDFEATTTGSNVANLAGSTDIVSDTAVGNGETLTISLDGGAAQTITFGAGNTNTAADLVTAIDAIVGTGAASIDGSGAITITTQNGEDLTLGGTGLSNLGLTAGPFVASNTLGLENGDSFDISVGSGSATTITIGTDGGSGEVNSVSELLSALNGITGVSAEVDSDNKLVVTSTTGENLTFAENSGTPLADLGLTVGEAVASNSANIENGDTFTVQVGDGTATTITFGTGTGEVNSASELIAALDAITNVEASVTDDGYLSIEATNGEDLVLAEGTNTPLSDLGITAGTVEATANSERAAFAAQFDEVRAQINQLAADASYNGNNLLAGDSLSVTFNEDGSSSLTVEGVNFTSTGLGIDASSDTFQKDSDINAAISDLSAATATLRSQASKFGSNLSVVETRQDFTKNLINVLETGAANLTLADTNEEGANLLALQTRQQLSSTSLSLASQADQNVLRLF